MCSLLMEVDILFASSSSSSFFTSSATSPSSVVSSSQSPLERVHLEGRLSVHRGLSGSQDVLNSRRLLGREVGWGRSGFGEEREERDRRSASRKVALVHLRQTRNHSETPASKPLSSVGTLRALSGSLSTMENARTKAKRDMECSTFSNHLR